MSRFVIWVVGQRTGTRTNKDKRWCIQLEGKLSHALSQFLGHNWRWESMVQKKSSRLTTCNWVPSTLRYNWSHRFHPIWMQITHGNQNSNLGNCWDCRFLFPSSKPLSKDFENWLKNINKIKETGFHKTRERKVAWNSWISSTQHHKEAHELFL